MGASSPRLPLSFLKITGLYKVIYVGFLGTHSYFADRLKSDLSNDSNLFLKFVLLTAREEV